MRSSSVSKKLVDTSRGRIAYLESGAPELPVVLLVHGIPTSGYLWRHVMRALEGRFRCLAPDLMGLGDTEVDPARTDFSMPSQAEMLEDFLDALGVERAHLVAHDQGGAAAQLLVTRREHRVRRLVLTNCVCFDNWPVPAVRALMRFARLPGADLLGRTGLMEWVETRTRFSRFRRGVVNRAALSDAAISEYLRPLRGTADERARFRAFLLAGSPRHTMAVLPRLRELRTPTLVLWAAEDTYIPVRWGRRLYETIPGAQRLEVVPGAGHFWPEERPEAFVEHLAGFLAEEEAAPEESVAAGSPAAAGEAPVVAAARLRRRRKCPPGEAAAPPAVRTEEAGR